MADNKGGIAMLDTVLTDADRFAVVDVETTGLYNNDRVVEVAVVTLDRSGRTIDEWDTLIDPQRDVGPVHIHGVTASMVSAAPLFEEVAAALAERIYGAVVVSHNTVFDIRMLVNEFARLGATVHHDGGLCTLRLSGMRLADACRCHRIDLGQAHRALADARACAQLLHQVATPCRPTAATIWGLASEYTPRTLRRDAVAAGEVPPMPYVARIAARAHHYGLHGAALAYLDMLDWALDDLVITRAEADQLATLARHTGLPLDQLQGVHLAYLDGLVAAALRDGLVTDDELELLTAVAHALGIDRDHVSAAVEGHRPQPGRPGVTLVPGLRVCFTGAATYPDGTELPRSRLEQIAEGLGLSAVGSVTTSGCDLLAAADPNSSSGKAGKARKYGIPVVSVEDLLTAEPGATINARR